MTTREICKDDIIAFSLITEIESENTLESKIKADGVRLLKAHFNPLGSDGRWSQEREFIYLELESKEKSTVRRMGMGLFKKELLNNNSFSTLTQITEG